MRGNGKPGGTPHMKEYLQATHDVEPKVLPGGHL